MDGENFSYGSNNSANGRYHLALIDAGGKQWLSGDGDATNAFPGTLKNRDFTASTTPNSKSYALRDTFVAVRNISDAGKEMRMSISVVPVPDSRGARL